MTTTKLLTVAVVGLLLLNLGLVGFLLWQPNKQTGPGGPPPAGPQRLIIERLHLDAEQQAGYDKLVSQHRQQTHQLNNRGIELYRRYYQLLKINKPEETQLLQFSREIADNQQLIATLNFKHFSDLKAICRADQQADFIKLVDDLSELFGKQPRPATGSNGSDGPRPGAGNGFPPPPGGENSPPPGGPPENFRHKP
jgi:periplasmic protein CpxP/Spy